MSHLTYSPCVRCCGAAGPAIVRWANCRVCRQKPMRVRPLWEVIRDMKRRTAEAGAAGPPPPGDFLSGRPTVYEYMSSDRYEDGARRRRATMLLMLDGTIAKVLLIDKDMSEQVWAVGETLDEAVGHLEEMLVSGSAPWQRTQEAPGRGRRK